MKPTTEETEALKQKITESINDLPMLVDYFKLMIYDTCIIQTNIIKNCYDTFLPESSKNNPEFQKHTQGILASCEKHNIELGKKLSEFIITPEELEQYKKYAAKKLIEPTDTDEYMMFYKLTQGLQIILESSAFALGMQKSTIQILSSCADVKNQNS